MRASLVAAATAAAAAALWERRDGYGDTPPPGGGSGDELPVPRTLAQLERPPWNVHRVRNRDNLSIDDAGGDGRALKITYKKGAHASKSGAMLLGNPFGLLPAETARLSYDVFFPADFDWVRAGKLPGLALGRKPGDVASGGNWKDDAGSVRVMWQRPRGDRALLKAYVYLAIHGGIGAAYEPQGPATKAVMNDDERTGFSLWYKKQPGLYATRGAWNSVSVFVRLNTPGRADGALELTVNGETRRVDDVVWRTDAAVKIVDAYFVSFFGGSSDRFDPPRDTYALFRNVAFSTDDPAAAQ